MKRSHFLWFLIGLVVLEALSRLFGIDKVANQVQLVSAAPWAYMIYRLEQLHRKHKG